MPNINNDLLKNFHSKFRSGNEIEVDRAVVTRAEYDAITSYIEDLGGRVFDYEEFLGDYLEQKALCKLAGVGGDCG